MAFLSGYTTYQTYSTREEIICSTWLWRVFIVVIANLQVRFVL